MNFLEFEQEIFKKKTVLVYLSSPKCHVCKIIKPKLYLEVKNKYPKLHWLDINLSQSLEISGQLQVFSIPTVIVYFSGKETIRKTRNFSISELLDSIERPYKILD